MFIFNIFIMFVFIFAGRVRYLSSRVHTHDGLMAAERPVRRGAIIVRHRADVTRAIERQTERRRRPGVSSSRFQTAISY